MRPRNSAEIKYCYCYLFLLGLLKEELCRPQVSKLGIFLGMGNPIYKQTHALVQRLLYSLKLCFFVTRYLPRLAQETFICEVEIMKCELTECEVTVEGEFVSHSTMEEWGWSESLDSMFDLCLKCAVFRVPHARPNKFLCYS